MSSHTESRASLEALVESEDLGLEILHPGGLAMTDELARLCDLRAGDALLDVASGSGAGAVHLATKFRCQVVGVDASPAMIERARARARESAADVEFQRGDAHALPFPDAAFDVVISECTLCLLDKERAVAEMVRVARPGGRVGMHDISWHQGAPPATRARLAEIEGERPETLAGWRALFEGAGLTDVRALDRSSVIPAWMREMRGRIGLRGQARLALKVLGRWGPAGLLRVWRSQRIFAGPHIGYALVVGRKAGGDGSGRPPGGAM